MNDANKHDSRTSSRDIERVWKQLLFRQNDGGPALDLALVSQRLLACAALARMRRWPIRQSNSTLKESLGTIR